MRKVYRYFKASFFKRYYNLKSVHRTFYIGGWADISSDLIADKYSYIGRNCLIPPGVKIGKYTMIAPEVKIIGGDHIFNNPEVPIIFSGRPEMIKTFIEDDVWVGTCCLIKSGINIGTGSIIAAGSIVVKDVEPYSIIGGNPSKFIRKRFNDEQVLIHKKMLLNEEIKTNYVVKKKI